MNRLFDNIQDCLNFEGVENRNYDSEFGLGRVGLIGYLLGVVGGVSFTLFGNQLLSGGGHANTALFPWTAYLFLLSLFHFLEFFVTSIYQPSTLSYNSFIVNHSKSYTMAAMASWFEFWIEYYVFGPKKLSFIYVCYIGIICTVVGQTIRSLAMSHCGENFSHIIADRKQDSHKLVTTGIYKYLRHPSYFGWFYWSVGTQLILMNPICVCAYAYVSWSFFKERIAYEELLLVKFFGESYQEYRRKVSIGIPFI